MTGQDVSAAYIRRACQESLRRLGTDRIDLYQLHLGGLPIARAHEVAGTLEDLAGDVRGPGGPSWMGYFTDGRPAPEQRRPARRHPRGAHQRRADAGPGCAGLAACPQPAHRADPGDPDRGPSRAERRDATARAAPGHRHGGDRPAARRLSPARLPPLPGAAAADPSRSQPHMTKRAEPPRCRPERREP